MDTDRKLLEYEVVKVILHALNYDEITFSEAQKASKYFLLNFTDNTDPVAFLKDISEKWAIFKPTLENQLKRSQFTHEDDVKLEKIKEQLSQLTQQSTHA